MPLIFEIRKDLRGMDRISHYYFYSGIFEPPCFFVLSGKYTLYTVRFCKERGVGSAERVLIK